MFICTSICRCAYLSVGLFVLAMFLLAVFFSCAFGSVMYPSIRRAVMLWLLMLSLRITSAVEDHLVWLPVNFRCFVVVLFLCPFFLLPCPVIFNPAVSRFRPHHLTNKQANTAAKRQASSPKPGKKSQTNKRTSKQTNKQTNEQLKKTNRQVSKQANRQIITKPRKASRQTHAKASTPLQ